MPKPKLFTESDIEIMRSHIRYCPETGKLFRKNPVMIGRHGLEICQSQTNGYYTTSIAVEGRVEGTFRLLVHRLAWMLVNGPIPEGMQVDHINCDRKDNRLANLRLVTHTENQQNQRRAHRSNRASGLLGARFDSRINRFYGSIKDSGRSVYLGSFLTAQEAHEAYLAAKRRLHRTCTI